MYLQLLFFGIIFRYLSKFIGKQKTRSDPVEKQPLFVWQRKITKWNVEKKTAGHVWNPEKNIGSFQTQNWNQHWTFDDFF